MGRTARQASLKKWSDQKWRTASGNPSTQGPKATGEVYQPAAKIKKLKSTPAGRKKLAAANRKKKKATQQGKQHARHGLNKKKTTQKKKK